MNIPGLQDLQTERAAVIETMESLTDDEFDHAPTLCAAWAPRDVLAHVMGLDTQLLEYVKAKGRVGVANQAIVDKARPQSRARLMNRARHWAERPAPLVAATAFFLLGDLAVHHQDVLRGLDRRRDVPDALRAAILREGMTLGAKTLLAHKVVPTDGGRSLGRGPEVRGTSEALGLWLAGRQGLDDELEFV